MARIRHIRWHRLVVPAVAAEQEIPLRCELAAARRKNSSTRASRSGKRLPKKPKVAAKPRIRCHRIMRRWVKGVVDRNALASAEASYRPEPPDRRRRRSGSDRTADMARRNGSCGSCASAIQRGRRIHIPEDDAWYPRRALVRISRSRSSIEYADAAGLHQDVGVTRASSRARYTPAVVRLIHVHPAPSPGSSMSLCC